MCLAWYGSQSEAAVNRCLWLRTILRQPVFPLWFVGSCFLCLTIQNCFDFHCFTLVILYSVLSYISLKWTLTTLHFGLIFHTPHQMKKIVTDNALLGVKFVTFPNLSTNNSWFSVSPPHSNHSQTVLAKFLLEKLLFAEKLLMFIFHHFNWKCERQTPYSSR